MRGSGPPQVQNCSGRKAEKKRKAPAPYLLHGLQHDLVVGAQSGQLLLIQLPLVRDHHHQVVVDVVGSFPDTQCIVTVSSDTQFSHSTLWLRVPDTQCIVTVSSDTQHTTAVSYGTQDTMTASPWHTVHCHCRFWHSALLLSVLTQYTITASPWHTVHCHCQFWHTAHYYCQFWHTIHYHCQSQTQYTTTIGPWQTGHDHSLTCITLSPSVPDTGHYHCWSLS